MTKAADEIKAILYNCKEHYPWLTESWLAGKVGMSPQALNWQLNKAKKFDQDLYDNVKAIFNDAGIIQGSKNECRILNALTLEFGSVICEEQSNLYKEVKRAIEDGIIIDNERQRLKIKLEDLKENIGNEFDRLESLINGK